MGKSSAFLASDWSQNWFYFFLIKMISCVAVLTNFNILLGHCYDAILEGQSWEFYKLDCGGYALTDKPITKSLENSVTYHRIFIGTHAWLYSDLHGFSEFHGKEFESCPLLQSQ